MGEHFPLSRRQGEIIGLVALGYTDKEIAAALGLSLATVKTYLGRLYRHYGFRNRAQAAAACNHVTSGSFIGNPIAALNNMRFEADAP